MEEDLDLEDFDIAEDETFEPDEPNKRNIIINVLFISQLVIGLIAFIMNCWLIYVDQGGPAVAVFFFILINMGTTIFLIGAKLHLKWFLIINE